MPPETDLLMSVGQRNDDSFAEWLEPISVQILVARDHGQWYATAEDFGVVGAGESESAALRNLGRVLAAYLHDFYGRGRPFKASLRSSSASAHPSLRGGFGAIARLVYEPVTRWLSKSHRRTVPLRSVVQ